MLGAVLPDEEARFRDLMATHHYLGAALKCRARDAWIGWTLRHKYDRLHLVANNTRFLLLHPVPNLGSRVLALCARQVARDWPARFRHPLVLLEALALDCYSILRNSGLLGNVMKIRHLLELGIFLPVPLRPGRRGRYRTPPPADPSVRD